MASPTRSAPASGKPLPQQRHVKLLVPDYVRNLPAADTTLAEALKQAGYRTFFAGKWHLGSKGSWPEDHGFDINKGGWDAGSPMGGYYAPWQNPNLPSGPRGESLTLRLASETISFIEQHKDKPFLAYLSFYAVHGPIQTTKPLWSKYRDKASRQPAPAERFKIDRTLPVRQVQDNPIYAGLIEEMDTAVGRVLTRLDELGLADNTIVCFTGDNGGVTSGDSFSSSELPYRGGKGRQWEGGLRVPFYIKAPGVTRPGSTCDTPVIHTDFYPTILQLAGLPLRPEQHVDGVSLVPLLKGGKIADRPLFWHYPHYGNQGGEPSSIIRKDDWKLIHYWEDNRNELYHLPDDIGEQHDLAKQEAARTAQLWAELQAGSRRPAPRSRSPIRNTRKPGRAAAGKPRKPSRPAWKSRTPPTSIPAGSPIPPGGRVSCPQIESHRGSRVLREECCGGFLNHEAFLKMGSKTKCAPYEATVFLLPCLTGSAAGAAYGQLTAPVSSRHSINSFAFRNG